MKPSPTPVPHSPAHPTRLPLSTSIHPDSSQLPIPLEVYAAPQERVKERGTFPSPRPAFHLLPYLPSSAFPPFQREHPQHRPQFVRPSASLAKQRSLAESEHRGGYTYHYNLVEGEAVEVRVRRSTLSVRSEVGMGSSVAEEGTALEAVGRQHPSRKS